MVPDEDMAVGEGMVAGVSFGECGSEENRGVAQPDFLSTYLAISHELPIDLSGLFDFSPTYSITHSQQLLYASGFLTRLSNSPY